MKKFTSTIDLASAIIVDLTPLASNEEGALEMDAVHTLKVRLKVVGGTEVRLELCCIVSLLGRGRVLGRGT